MVLVPYKCSFISVYSIYITNIGVILHYCPTSTEASSKGNGRTFHSLKFDRETTSALAENL